MALPLPKAGRINSANLSCVARSIEEEFVDTTIELRSLRFGMVRLGLEALHYAHAGVTFHGEELLHETVYSGLVL